MSVDVDTLEILQASLSCAEVLGVAAPLLVGRPLDVLVGDISGTAVRTALVEFGDRGTARVDAQVHGQRFDVIVHRSDGIGVVEFEPAEGPHGIDYVATVHAAMRRLYKAPDAAILRIRAVQEIRALTGYDQVTLYDFHDDGHGEVVADEHDPDMNDYLGLHFPASDIPAQARRLYLLKGSGLIANSIYQPSALYPAHNPRNGEPLDLSLAELRSVSPYHLQFMRNMQQASSLTLSVMLSGKLLGMITCSHRQPRRVPFLLRRACEILTQQVALQLDSMDSTGKVSRQLQAQDIRNLLVNQLRKQPHGAAGLLGPNASMLDLARADGAVVCMQTRLSAIGNTPANAQTRALLEALTDESGDISPLVSEALAADRPDLAAMVPSVAGALVLPFGGAGNCVAWFRREVAQTVDWMGEQSLSNRAGPLAPRNSFAMWRETVANRSWAWDETDVAQAAELCRDIGEVMLRRAEAELAHLGLHDALTGLPNRNLLVDRINSAVSRADRDGGEVAVLFCDLDHFKRVNDTAGHAAGDAVLVEAAGRLKGVLRAEDSVARVGGDEFVVVVEPSSRSQPGQLEAAQADGQIPPSVQASRLAAAQIAGRIQSELSRPFSYNGDEHLISVSVGMTFAPRGSRAEELLRDADAAMYMAKRGGKDRVELFDGSIKADISERARIERTLRSALGRAVPDGSRLGVAFQPIFDLGNRRLVSFEVLARLTDAAGQMMPASTVIEIAEQTGMIGTVGEYVLEAGLAGLVRWRQENPATDRVTVSVNFSVRQAQRADMVDVVWAALDRHQLTPADLTLELTESVLMEAGSAALDQLTRLHSAGVGISIDDFGTGYASLSYLATLPVTAVKIDRTFTAGLPDNRTSAILVSAVAGLAAEMGLACIVEGIETEQQLAALPPGVHGQGFLLGVPLPDPVDAWDRPAPA